MIEVQREVLLLIGSKVRFETESTPHHHTKLIEFNRDITIEILLPLPIFSSGWFNIAAISGQPNVLIRAA